MSRASIIVSISQSVKKAVDSRCKKLGVQKKTEVVYCGVDRVVFSPTLKEAAARYLQNTFGINCGYVLFVGTIEPRKNIINLLKAFEEFSLMTTAPYLLVLAGANGWKSGPILKELRAAQVRSGRIKILGAVKEESLPFLYAGASVVTLPSWYEGFGMPPLEAMSCAIPTVVSDIEVFKELYGRSALCVDPREPHDIAQALYRAVSYKPLQDQLRSAGEETAQGFSWDTSAKKMHEILTA
jgi:alpha-1,3-rhamnosyl/mannosyltransferase